MGFVEKLGVKDKKSLEENDCSLVESDSVGFRAQVSAQSHEAIWANQMGGPLLC